MMVVFGYDAIAPGYDELYGNEQRQKFALVCSLLPELRPGTLLDVGCGTALARPFFPEWDYIGIDSSRRLLENSKQHAIALYQWVKKEKKEEEIETEEEKEIEEKDAELAFRQRAEKDLSLIQGAGEALPFPDRSFQMVICISALHNFSDFRKGLMEMDRVANGLICVSIMKRAARIIEMLEYIDEHFSQIASAHEEKDHVLIFRPKR